jgi:hypothetical protein
LVSLYAADFPATSPELRNRAAMAAAQDYVASIVALV